MEFIKNCFYVLLMIIGLVIVICTFCFSIWIIGNGLDNILDKSMCNAYVENQQVYSGRCHFLNIDSIGQNGNTKKLIICKDIFNLKPVKVYVNNDIKIGKGE